MGIRAYYYKYDNKYLGRFKFYLEKEDQFMLTDFVNENLFRKYLISISLDKSYHILSRILGGRKKYYDHLENNIAAMTISGQENPTYDYSFDYIEYENIVSINDFIQNTRLKSKKKFIAQYKIVYEESAKSLNLNMDEISVKYLEDKANDWTDDLDKVCANIRKMIDKRDQLRKEFPFRETTRYERFRLDLECDYANFLRLEKFYKDCLRDPNCWVLINIS